MPARAFGQHDASNTTGQSAKPYKSARPHRHRGVGRCTPSTLESAVELRLGENRAGRLEDVVGTKEVAISTSCRLASASPTSGVLEASFRVESKVTNCEDSLMAGSRLCDAYFLCFKFFTNNFINT